MFIKWHNQITEQPVGRTDKRPAGRCGFLVP